MKLPCANSEIARVERGGTEQQRSKTTCYAITSPAHNKSTASLDGRQESGHGDLEETGKQGFVMPLGLDMHTHLRQGEIMALVTPMVKQGGCGVVLVMPNTVPPIVTCTQAKAYRERLLQLDNSVDYMMTLYLCPSLTVEDLKKNAKASHVSGVKSYPKGVTTNSEQGVETYDVYYPLFDAMQELGLVLHLHGEHPDVNPLDAEEKFLPIFEQLHSRFPSLKIVLEHVSTAKAVRLVKSRPAEVVGATITPHHLMLTLGEVLNVEMIEEHRWETCCVNAIAQPHNFCKPLAKTKEDREALREVVREGDPHFFLGSDSAPHLRSNKEKSPPAAGVFTQPLLLAYVADILRKIGCIDKLRAFAVDNAVSFFDLPSKGLREGEDCVLLERINQQVPLAYPLGGTSDTIVPFMAGKTLSYTVRVQPYHIETFRQYIKLIQGVEHEDAG